MLSDLPDGDDLVTVTNPFAGGSDAARLYDVIVRLQTPQPVAELAARSDCAPETVREQLWAFISLGIVVEHRHEPPIYARNDAYFAKEDS